VIDLERLNPPQREAVTHGDGALLVLAGAGSGKTRVLTYRVAHLIAERGVRPEQILAVTFTNKAAGEMRERLHALLGDAGAGLTVGTFHAVCARWLRREAPALGLPSSFAIFDDADQLILCRRALAETEVSEELISAQALRVHLDRKRNAAESVASDSSGGRDEALARAAARYEELLHRAGGVDFGGLIVHMIERLRRDPERRRAYRERYTHLLVDEYQDINHAQYLLVRELAGSTGQLSVVGDDDQSIYGFRGATVRAILDFGRDYPDAHVVRLEQNYRSTGNILAAAGAVIQQNVGRHGKTLWTDQGPGEKVVVATLPDDRAEARFVAGDVASAIATGRDASEIAVCYRTNAQSRLLEEELVRRGLAYVLIGGTRFYDRKEIKDVLAYLRLLANPADDVSLTRIINVPTRGIGATTLALLTEAARRRGQSIFAVIESLERDEDVPGLGAASRTRVLDFRALMRRLRAAVDHTPLDAIVETVIRETGLAERLRAEGTQEAELRADNLSELIGAAREVEGVEGAFDGIAAIEAFLEKAALVSDLDQGDRQRSVVTLLTLHNSKGLEFPLVYLIGMEERVFPHMRAIDSGDVEEERRLCYVGMTRARERLVLTRARHRVLFGSSQQNPPSRFLREIPAEVTLPIGGFAGFDEERAERSGRFGDSAIGRALSDERWSSGPRRESDAVQRTEVDYSFSQEPEVGAGSLAIGTRVRHPQFGTGVVRRREGSGEGTKLTVQFERAGLKKLLLRFAPLEVVGS
jgi:DNA helicase-2/ATP-dependent DNA helicase PcrA